MEQSDLVVNLTILLAAALVGGMIAHRLKQPIILGYLVVGGVIGPYALGLVTDVALVQATATIGVALLMLTLGLEVSFSQLKQVGRVGLWGGIAQLLITTLVAMTVSSVVFHWSWREATLFGLIVSLSSTLVGMKVLMDRGELDSLHGRIMLAILILQDMAVVLMIMVEPILGHGTTNLLLSLAITVGSIILFVGLAIIAGIWVLPWLMGRIGGVRSRELFLLTVLVICLGAALGTQTVGLSSVFGAFLIGLVLRETRFAHQALAEVTPLRDIFAALFFVSLGMLLDVKFALDNWQMVLTAIGIIIVVKVLVTAGVVRFFGYNGRVALLTGVGLFQIGEFGFILAQDGVNIGVISAQSYALIVASAIVTMLLTPLGISLTARFYGKLPSLETPKKTPTTEMEETTKDVVIAGYGRIGQSVGHLLADAGIPFSAIEADPEVVSKVCHGGTACMYGDASNFHCLDQLNLSQVKVLIVTFPDPIAVLTTVKSALSINPALKVIARVHRTRESEILNQMGVYDLVSPEYEASLEFLRRILIATSRGKNDIHQIMTAATRDKEVLDLAKSNQEG